MRFSKRCLFLLFLSTSIPAGAQDNPKTVTYRKTTQADLNLEIDYPSDWKQTDKRPAIVFFFGGGWENGTIKAFERQSRYFASRGLVSARADYRVKSRHGVTPKDCVDDARAAVRYLRQNADALGIDPDRIVASGGSAGGHIAACTTLKPDADNDTEVSSNANALILFNPVLRFGPQMLARVNHDEAVGKAISPILYIAKTSPPTLILFGTNDGLLKQGEEFIERSKVVGCRAEMLVADQQPHGFFHRSPWYEKTLFRADEFLESLGYLKGKPTVKIPEDTNSRSD